MCALPFYGASACVLVGMRATRMESVWASTAYLGPHSGAEDTRGRPSATQISCRSPLALTLLLTFMLPLPPRSQRFNAEFGLDIVQLGASLDLALYLHRFPLVVEPTNRPARHSLWRSPIKNNVRVLSFSEKRSHYLNILGWGRVGHCTKRGAGVGVFLGPADGGWRMAGGGCVAGSAPSVRADGRSRGWLGRTRSRASRCRGADRA